MFGNRDLNQILRAIIGKQHYIALLNMYRNYPNFFENLRRYLTASGCYPYEIQVRTPTGTIKPTLYSHHDLLTVNEIFCRLDYSADKNINTVIDLGSNIGISALYFLTRNKTSKCYLFEPDPRNIEKLRKNLLGFEERYNLSEKAVSNECGEFDFGIEPTGRYGGIGKNTGNKIKVTCLDINGVLGEILEKEDYIDILKIDIEGIEIYTVEGIKGEYLKRIRKIYLEAYPQRCIHPSYFHQKQYGGVCQLINKNP
jgi:FkbM family methyltransferase